MDQKQKILINLSFLGLFIMALVVVFGDNGMLDLFRIRGVQERLAQRNKHIQMENVTLYREIDRLQNDPAYQEEIARKEYGFVRPDEIVVQINSLREPAK